MGNGRQSIAIAVPVGPAGRRWARGQAVVMGVLLVVLVAFILYPLLRVLFVALSDGEGLTLRHLGNFFHRPLFREAVALSTRIAVISAGAVMQEGTPREIYEAPRERFVAEFVGASNLLAGEVRNAAGDGLTVATELGVEVRLAVPGPGVRPAGRVLLTIRPEAMDLLPCEDPADRRNRLEDTVLASAFQGAAIEYEVEVGAPCCGPA